MTIKKGMMLLTFLMLLWGFAQAQEREATPATVCELVDRPAEYNGKLVHVRAYITRVPHAGVIAPRGCGKSTESNYIALIGPERPTPDSERLLKILRTHPVEADVTGTFRSGGAFGGGNCCRFELAATQIEKVRKAKATVPSR